jgi:hypothetical protein
LKFWSISFAIFCNPRKLDYGPKRGVLGRISYIENRFVSFLHPPAPPPSSPLPSAERRPSSRAVAPRCRSCCTRPTTVGTPPSRCSCAATQGDGSGLPPSHRRRLSSNRQRCLPPHRPRMWQNRLNYSGSSALVIAMLSIRTQRTSNGITYWSVGSPPDTTTVQQDRSRFTSHEGEFTITIQLINF